MREAGPAPRPAPGPPPFAVVRDGFGGAAGRALLFDMDGVLLDVGGSFRRVVCEAANRYLGEAGIRVWESPPFRPEDVRLFKDAGGFNHEADVALGAAEFFLWKAKALETSDPVRLRNESPTLPETLARARDAGGGMEGLRSLLGLARADLDVRRLERWCEQLYAGVEHCARLYGYAPESWVGRGALDEEFPLLGKRGRALLNGQKVGVVTGRTPEETAIGLQRLGCRELVQVVVSCDGTIPRKPDPAGIATALGALDEPGGFYFGDTLDDLRAAINFNAGGLRGPVASVLCASGEGTGSPGAALAEGWDVVVPGVEDGIAFATDWLAKVHR